MKLYLLICIILFHSCSYKPQDKHLVSSEYVVDSIKEHVSYEQYENVISNTCINDCNEYKQNLLHEAIACCRNDIATNLINRNNINQQDYKGETPLHYCAAYFNLEIAELLLQKKAQINIIDKYGNNLYGLRYSMLMVIIEW